MTDTSPLPWNDQQWQSLRSVVQEAAKKARIASTFLPVCGAPSEDDATVPALWTQITKPGTGEAPERLQMLSGKTLHLITIASNVELSGSEVSDPDLAAAKSKLRRAAEVLGRLEDAIVFNGLPKADTFADLLRLGADGFAKVQPQIYTVSGGSDFTGLLQAPDAFFEDIDAAGVQVLRGAHASLKLAAPGNARQTAQKSVRTQENQVAAKLMAVRCPVGTPQGNGNDLVESVIEAVQKLESRSHFGPFAAVFGNHVYRTATSPQGSSIVLPKDRILPFLEGGPLHRSSTIPDNTGLIIAIGGQPIELVLGSDIDVQFVQVTLEPRYVLRVYERLVLRIKELDAVCKIVLGDTDLFDQHFTMRKASR
jgi:uncharacterized linocin/CFP29 family protein